MFWSLCTSSDILFWELQMNYFEDLLSPPWRHWCKSIQGILELPCCLLECCFLFCGLKSFIYLSNPLIYVFGCIGPSKLRHVGSFVVACRLLFSCGVGAPEQVCSVVALWRAGSSSPIKDQTCIAQKNRLRRLKFGSDLKVERIVTRHVDSSHCCHWTKSQELEWWSHCYTKTLRTM